MPKRLGMKQAERVARMSAGVINVISKVVSPAIWLLSVSTNGVLRLMGIDPKDDEENVTEEEIRMMVDIGGQRGTIESGEGSYPSICNTRQGRSKLLCLCCLSPFLINHMISSCH